jgi:exodeoxyribonuclease V alpha subunit
MKFIKGYIQGTPYSNIDNIQEEEDINESNIDMYNDSKEDIDIYFVIFTIIDENDNKYKIKGKTTIRPEEYDEVCICNYEINEETYNKRTECIYSSNKNLISIKFSANKDNIFEILKKLNINKYSDNELKKIIDKYGEKIWYMDYDTINDKLIRKNFIDNIKEYINNRLKKNNRMSKYILDYLIWEYNINITIKEYKKIEREINVCQIKFPFDTERMEYLILILIGKLEQDKILYLCEKFNLSHKSKNKILLYYLIINNIKYGSSCIKKEKIIKEANNNIDSIDELIKELEDEEFICKYKDYIYNFKQYYFEKNIAENLEKYINKFDIDTKYEKHDINEIIYKTSIINPTDEQITGFLNLINNPVSIITGGPGYGKTTILKLLIDNLNYFKRSKNITIIGPTGKVVSKIKDDLKEFEEKCSKYNININTYTLHKLLFNVQNKNQETIEKLENSSYIIIDELSMVSNKYFDQFLDILDKNNCNSNLLFIGDCEQLLAIDEGDVLKSLINSYCIPVVKLTINQRAKEFPELVNAIEKIKKGEIPNNTDQFKIINSSTQKIKDKLIDMIAELMNKKIKFKDIGILTSTRKIIKKFTDDVRNYVYKYETCKEYNIANRQLNKDEYDIGDYIYIKKNIYIGKTELYDNYKNYLKIKKDDTEFIPIAIRSKIDLFNGMFGKIDKIVNIDGEEYYSVDFDYKKDKKDNTDSKEDKNALFEYNFFNKNFINDMAYINTVHKYQGSENKYIIFILPHDDTFSKRNLIYTAVSRAKNQCIIIGDKDTFVKCIEKKEYRVSQLHNMIKNSIYNDNLSDETSDETIITYNKQQYKNYDNKKGIPTIGLNNIECRSKIEAIWSYVFNYINWVANHETYNESKIKGYIPDYLIKKSEYKTIKNLYIEIKADIDFESFYEYYQKAVDSGIEDNALLILNNGFEETNHEKIGLCILIGKIFFNYRDKIRKSEFFLYKNRDDEFTHVYLYKNRLYNRINKKCIIKDVDNDDIDYEIKDFENFTTDEDINIFTNKINSFRNKTQWKPVKSK